MDKQDMICTDYDAYRPDKDPDRHSGSGQKETFLKLEQFSGYPAQKVRKRSGLFKALFVLAAGVFAGGLRGTGYL